MSTKSNPYYELKKIQDKHRKIIRLLPYYSDVVIARYYGVTTQTIRNIRHSPLVREIVDKWQDSLDEEALLDSVGKLREHLLVEGAASLDVLRRIRDASPPDEENDLDFSRVSPALQLRAADKLLNKVGVSDVKVVEVSGSVEHKVSQTDLEMIRRYVDKAREELKPEVEEAIFTLEDPDVKVHPPGVSASDVSCRDLVSANVEAAYADAGDGAA